MKLSVPAAKLGAALSSVGRATAARNTIPILSSVLLEATDGVLAIWGTDLDILVKAVIEATVEQGGAVTVPMSRLADLVAKLPAGADVSLELVGGRLQLRCGRARANM